MKRPMLRDILGRDLPRVSIVDVGAGVEASARYAPLLEQQAADVIGFEGDLARAQEREQQAAGALRCLPYFIGSGQAATFHVTRYAGCSSLYEPDPAVINQFTGMSAEAQGNFEVLARRRVETRRLDDVPECPSADLLCLDVQGAELDVLRQATKVLATAMVIEVETEFVPLYRDQPLFGDVQMFLREQGFVLHKLIDLCGRCFRPVVINENTSSPLSQLLWADAVFLRDWSTLFAASDEVLLRTARILHDLYASCDLVARLLGIVDQRQGSDLRAGYQRSLAAGVPMLYLNPKIDPALAVRP